jgi:hypothetical protein
LSKTLGHKDFFKTSAFAFSVPLAQERRRTIVLLQPGTIIVLVPGIWTGSSSHTFQSIFL